MPDESSLTHFESRALGSARVGFTPGSQAGSEDWSPATAQRYPNGPLR